MIRLLWRTDVHCCDHTPASRTDDWVETVLGKLAQVGEIARSHNCDAVIDGGDFWNDKTPVRTSHRLVTRVAAVHARYSCPTYANVGNHDLRLALMDNLGESPLETLFASGVFRRLYDEHELILEREGVKVRVVGVPYHGVRYDLERFRRIERRDEDWLVCAAHVLASPQGGEMFKNEDILGYEDLPALMPGVDVMLFGHWHKNQGITDLGGKYVVNVGSLTRGSLTQDNLDRTPGVVVMGFWPRASSVPPSLDFVPLKVQAAADVFDVDKRAQEELRASMIDSFVESVKSELRGNAARPYEELLAEMEIPNLVRERALEYIERARRDQRR